MSEGEYNPTRYPLVAVTDNDEVSCPACGGDRMQWSTATYEPAEHCVVIQLECETCRHECDMHIVWHEGSTYMRWYGARGEYAPPRVVFPPAPLQPPSRPIDRAAWARMTQSHKPKA